MVFKKVSFCVFFLMALSLCAYAEDLSAPQKAGSKLEDVNSKLTELQKGQEEIMKELKSLKEELNVIKIRVTHR